MKDKILNLFFNTVEFEYDLYINGIYYNTKTITVQTLKLFGNVAKSFEEMAKKDNIPNAEVWHIIRKINGIVCSKRGVA